MITEVAVIIEDLDNNKLTKLVFEKKFNANIFKSLYNVKDTGSIFTPWLASFVLRKFCKKCNRATN